MSGFDPLVVVFKDQQKVIPSSRVMRVGAEVENFIPYGSIQMLVDPNKFNFALVSMAYAVLLRNAGIAFDEKTLLHSITSADASADAARSLLSLFDQYKPLENLEAPKESKKKPRKKSAKISK